MCVVVRIHLLIVTFAKLISKFFKYTIYLCSQHTSTRMYPSVISDHNLIYVISELDKKHLIMYVSCSLECASCHILCFQSTVSSIALGPG